MTLTSNPNEPKELNADDAKKVAGGTLHSRPSLPGAPTNPVQPPPPIMQPTQPTLPTAPGHALPPLKP